MAEQISRTFKISLIQKIGEYQIKNKIPLEEIAQKSGLEIGTIRRLQKQKWICFSNLYKILKALNKWYNVELIDDPLLNQKED